jgi:hypothetical protein
MAFVYRYYDQAELERQLNVRATVPDIMPVLARYASESPRMRRARRADYRFPTARASPSGSIFFQRRPSGHRWAPTPAHNSRPLIHPLSAKPGQCR